MANIDPYNVNEKISIAQNEFDSIYKTHRHNRTAHKCLDFSNVNIPDSANGGRIDFRKFHQTRIFVQEFGGMQGHCKNQGVGTFMITANLPKTIQYNLTSKWSAPLDFMQSKYANLAAQFLAPKLGVADQIPSTANRATTIQVWEGAEPLELQLTIPVIDDGVTDSHTNLVEALEYLGSLVLPGQGSDLGFLTPPPSPSSFSFRYGSGKDQRISFRNVTTGRITVLLGGILLLDNMIMDQIIVNYPNTKAMVRHDYTGFGNAVGTGAGQQYLTPLLAEVTIKIKTVEALTKETYSRMLWLKPQRGSGDVDAVNTSAIGDMAMNVGEGIVNTTKEAIGYAKEGAKQLFNWW